MNGVLKVIAVLLWGEMGTLTLAATQEYETINRHDLIDHRSERERLIEQHFNPIYEFTGLQFDQEASELAHSFFPDMDDSTRRCTTNNYCFDKMRGPQAHCPESYGCFVITERQRNYSARYLVSTYFKAAYDDIVRVLRPDTKFGCAIHAVGSVADINCVYMRPRARTIRSKAKRNQM